MTATHIDPARPGRHTARRRALAAAALLATLAASATLSACNTVAGAGEDVGAVGNGVARGAEGVKNGS